MATPQLPTYYDVGLISVENGSTSFTVTGGGAGEIAWGGDMLFLPSQPLVPVQRLADFADGVGELAFPWPGTTETDVAYEIRFVGMIERSTAQSRRVLEQLGEVSAYFDIQVDDTAARLALESVDAPLRANYRVLVSDIGDGSAAIYSKATSTYNDWTDPAPYSGPKGDRGWSPIFAVATDGARRVQQLVGYGGGEGDEPTAHVGEYVGPSGYTAVIGDGVDIRGAAGANGAGTVASVVAGAGISVDNTDPANPVVSMGLLPFGQCYLLKSGANLVLQPHRGNKLAINGVNYPIPAAGIILAATGLTPGTAYFVYAYMSGGTMTLEASASGPEVNATTGVSQKTGDATRTLVGLWLVVTGPAWSAIGCQGASWFNPGLKGGSVGPITQATTSTATSPPAELVSTLRLDFVTFGGRNVRGVVRGRGGVSVATSDLTLDIGLDGATAQLVAPVVARNGDTNSNDQTPLFGSCLIATTEGKHYLTALAAVSTGTGTFTNVTVQVSIEG